MKKTPGHNVLDGYTACSSERIEVLSTRCNAIILYDTLPAHCISKVVVMESGDIINEKECVSPRPPPTISFKDNWMKELDSDIAGSSKDTQRIDSKPKTQLSMTVRPADGQESTKEILFDHEDIKHSTRTGRPVGGQECLPRWRRSTLTSGYQDCHMQF